MIDEQRVRELLDELLDGRNNRCVAHSPLIWIGSPRPSIVPPLFACSTGSQRTTRWRWRPQRRGTEAHYMAVQSGVRRSGRIHFSACRSPQPSGASASFQTTRYVESSS